MMYKNMLYDDGRADLGEFVPGVLRPQKKKKIASPLPIPRAARGLGSISESGFPEGFYEKDARTCISWTGSYSVKKGGINMSSRMSEVSTSVGSPGSVVSSSTGISSGPTSSVNHGGSGAAPAPARVPARASSRERLTQVPRDSRFFKANKAASIALTHKKWEEARARMMAAKAAKAEKAEETTKEASLTKASTL